VNIIYSGCIGRFPIGGQAWADMQYLLGLSALGHDVLYLEECGPGSWVYNWETQEVTTQIGYPASYVRSCLDPIGYQNRWIYRAGSESAGMTLEEFHSFCSEADLLIVRGSPIDLWREEYDWPKSRIFIDADPAFTQIKLAEGDVGVSQTVAHCQRLFTYGTRIGNEDCPIPTGNREWLKTVMPIFLPLWPVVEEGNATHFTTIMQWRSYATVSYNGVRYGNKDLEFPKFISLPRYTEHPFRVALTGAPPEKLTDHGWDVVPGWIATETPSSYQLFVQNSYAEFGVAKHAYVASRSGWMSDRSICYLASGRPVLVQDTAFSDWLPVGEGVLTFRDTTDALKGIEAINSDYGRHRRGARLLAEEYFSTDKVLSQLMQEALA
jgi:hypothetical protein